MNLLSSILCNSCSRNAVDHSGPLTSAERSSRRDGGGESRPVVSESAYARRRSPVWDKVRSCSIARSYTLAATSAERLSSTRTLLRRPMTGLDTLSPTSMSSGLPGNSRQFIPKVTQRGCHSAPAGHLGCRYAARGGSSMAADCCHMPPSWRLSGLSVLARKLRHKCRIVFVCNMFRLSVSCEVYTPLLTETG